VRSASGDDGRKLFQCGAQRARIQGPRCNEPVRQSTPVFFCLRSSCNRASEIRDRRSRDIRAETCCAKWRGLCGYNREQTSKYCLIIAGRSLSSFRIIAPGCETVVYWTGIKVTEEPSASIFSAEK
jgi:hypothetical protein